MPRRVLLCAAVIALFAPGLLAQGITVCVFQGKESRDVAAKYASDIQNMAAELSGKTMQNGTSIQAIAIPDVKPKEEDAAAQSHHCEYVLNVSREEILAAPAGFSGNLSAGGPEGGHINQSAMAQQDDTHLDYALRKTSSRKKLLSGESNSGSPWNHIADEVVKKLAREEK